MPAELAHEPRAVAIGTFDGVHLGHQRVIEAALAAGPKSTVVTFDPHPRVALGNQVELLTTLDRRLQLFDELGIADTLVIEFTPDTARLEPEEFVDGVLRPIGTEVIAELNRITTPVLHALGPSFDYYENPANDRTR